MKIGLLDFEIIGVTEIVKNRHETKAEHTPAFDCASRNPVGQIKSQGYINRVEWPSLWYKKPATSAEMLMTISRVARKQWRLLLLLLLPSGRCSWHAGLEHVHRITQCVRRSRHRSLTLNETDEQRQRWRPNSTSPSRLTTLKKHEECRTFDPQGACTPSPKTAIVGICSRT